MKRKKITAIISLFLVLMFSTATAEETTVSYDLGKLYELAVKHSEQIKIAEEELFIAKKDKSRALSALIPDITAFGVYSKEDADIENDPSSPPSSFPDLSQKTDTTTWGVRFDQSFTLNGRELTALNISKKMIKKSRYDLEDVKEEYLFQVASAYYSVLQTQRGIEIADADVKRLEKHKSEVEIRLSLEDATKTDLYRIEAELSGAKSQHIDLKNKHKSAKSLLMSLVKLPTNFKLLEPSNDTGELASMNLNALQEKGLSRRALIKSSETGYEIEKKNKQLANGAYWPIVSLEGQYTNSKVETDISGPSASDGTNDYSPVLNTDTDNEAYSIGAKLSFTILDGGLRRAEIKQAAANKRIARLGLEYRKKNVRLEIENTFLDVQTQQSKLNALSDMLKFSKQNYKAVAEMFKHGLANSVDTMDANTKLVEAERELSNAEYDYRLAFLKLKKETGTFLEETGLKL